MANEFVARKGIVSLGNIQVSGSISATGAITITGSIASASFAATASSADNFVVRQNLTGSNVLATGTITAQTLVVQTVTSSIVYSSGSNIFGNQLTDTQRFTGSMFITGSTLNVNGGAICATGNTCFGGNTIIAGCLGIGTATVSANARLSVCGAIESMFDSVASEGGHLTLRGQSTYLYRWNIDNKADELRFFREDDATSANGCLALTITGARIACFANTVCAPNVSIVNCLGVGTAAGAGFILDVYQPASSTTAYARIKNNRTRNAALQLETNCGNYLVGVGIGTDTNRFMIYDSNAGATRLTLDQCGNVGLSTTPAAWVSTARAFQINAHNSISSQHNGSFNIMSEAYESAANTFAYSTTGGYPTRINMNPNDGVISIFNAPTGTATNTITWCERMRITCGGFVKMSNTGTYIDSAANYYEMRSSLNNPVLFVWASNASYADDILSVRAERNTTNNTFKAIRYYNQGAAADRFYITDGGGGYFACSVGIRTTSTSTEGNLFLGANSTEEGGQLVLQKATNYSCATHLDNYANQFRVLSGTDTGTTAVHMMIDHTTRNACFYGALYVPETYIQGPTISYAAQLNPAGPAYTQDLQLVICHSNWGGNDDTGTVYVEYTARAYAVSQTTAAYGTMTYRLNNGGTQIGSFGTGGVTTSCVTITGDVGTSRVLKINFAVSQNVDRITVFARTTNPFVTSVTGILV